VRVDEQSQGRVLRLEATNPTYDTITIGENQVVEIYRVVGNLKMY
jgi:SOS-response transcriptional repressor LexA